jgi:biotin carboxyl carrier protein
MQLRIHWRHTGPFACCLSAFLICVCILVAEASAQTPSPSASPSVEEAKSNDVQGATSVFPPGVSLRTASNRELATAVKAAIFQRPEQAPEIVSRTVAELAKGGRLIPQRVPPSARDAAVTAVLVKKGQKVTTGQILAVLEVQGKK